MGYDRSLGVAELGQRLVLAALDQPGSHRQQLVWTPLLCISVRDHQFRPSVSQPEWSGAGAQR
jgi:hypothetical protein